MNLKTLLFIVYFIKPWVIKGILPENRPVKIYWVQPEPKTEGKFKNGLKHGYWIFYNKEGWVEKREKWNRGKLLHTIYFNKNHKKTKWIYPNGKEKIYKNCNCSN